MEIVPSIFIVESVKFPLDTEADESAAHRRGGRWPESLELASAAKNRRYGEAD